MVNLSYTPLYFEWNCADGFNNLKLTIIWKCEAEKEVLGEGKDGEHWSQQKVAPDEGALFLVQCRYVTLGLKDGISF